MLRRVLILLLSSLRLPNGKPQAAFSGLNSAFGEQRVLGWWYEIKWLQNKGDRDDGMDLHHLSGDQRGHDCMGGADAVQTRQDLSGRDVFGEGGAG